MHNNNHDVMLTVDSYAGGITNGELQKEAHGHAEGPLLGFPRSAAQHQRQGAILERKAEVILSLAIFHSFYFPPHH